MSVAVPLHCPFPHRTRPPEANRSNIVSLKYTPSSCVKHDESFPQSVRIRNNVSSPLTASPHNHRSPIAKMTPKAPTPRQCVAQVNTRPKDATDYSAYVPVKIGSMKTSAYIDSGNTFANVISPKTMTALGIRQDQLEPVPQLSVGTAAAGKSMKVLGQTPRITLTFGDHPTKFRIRPLVLQGLVHPLNICGPFLSWFGIDQLHSKHALLVQGKEVPMGRSSHRAALPPLQDGPNVCTLEVPQSNTSPVSYHPSGTVHHVSSGPETITIEG